MVTIGGSLNLLSQQLDEGNVRLFHHLITSLFFCFSGHFYEQMDGVAMGSLLLSMITNFFIEDLMEVALSRVAYWLCYMDDIFMIWPQVLEGLND